MILENYYLTGCEIAAASKIMEKAGADFIKTSSGYAPGGAKIGDLRIMRASVTGAVQIKAAGGVRTLDKALAVLAVGGTRFGCTQTVSIMAEARQREAAGTLAVPYTLGRRYMIPHTAMEHSQITFFVKTLHACFNLTKMVIQMIISGVDYTVFPAKQQYYYFSRE